MRFSPIVLCILFVFAASVQTQAQTTITPNIHPPKHHNPNDTVGVVNGDIITYRDFRSELKRTMSDHVSEIKDKKVTDTLFTQFVNLTWDKMVADILVAKEVRRRKINVLKDEAIKRIINNPPGPFVKSFTDSLGSFHPDALKQFLTSPAQDSLRDGAIAYYQLIFEQDDFVKAIAPHAETNDAKKAAVDLWIENKSSKANIDDRRTAFGFY